MSSDNRMKNLIVWGASGQAIVLEEFLFTIGFKIITIFDNNSEIQSPFKDIPIYYGMDGFKQWQEGNKDRPIYFVIAIGGWRGNERLRLHHALESQGLIAATAIHPSSYVAANAVLGPGCQVLGNSFIGARAVLGKQVIINSSSSIDHECILSDGVHVAPGAVLAGCVEVGKASFIGVGAAVLPRIKIGNNVIIGAGTVVNRSIPDNHVVYGNPGKIVRENK